MKLKNKIPTRSHLLYLLYFLDTHTYNKWHLVGFLFFNYHNDARSNKHQIPRHEHCHREGLLEQQKSLIGL